LKVKEVKNIKELPKLTKKPLARERNEMVKKNSILWDLEYWLMLDVRHSIDKPYDYVSVDLRVLGYKNEPFVFANDVEKVFYVPELVMKNWSMVLLEKKDCWG
jgi:hypothetical protein